MKLRITLWIFLLFAGRINCIVYLRTWNDRGPGAVNSGLGCLEQVAKYYFKNQSWQTPNLALFHNRRMTAPAGEIEAKYLASLHQRISDPNSDKRSFQLKVMSENVTDVKYEGILDVTLTDFYAIISDSTETLNRTLEVISRTRSFNQEARYLILFNNPDQRSEGKQIACDFLNLLFTQYRAVNVVFLYGSDAFAYDIYTGDPYGKHGKVCGDTSGDGKAVCGKMKIFIAGKCNHGTIEDVATVSKWLDMDKIPEEMENDCVFRLCARVQEPFINQGCRSGLEISIMHFLQSEMGFEVNTTCTDMDRGELQENGSWSHLLGRVREGGCDIIAGAFFPDYDTHDYFAATDFYLQDYYRFFIPKAYLEARWKGLISIYNSEIWYAVISVFFISWIFWFFVGIFSPESYQHRQFVLISLNVVCVTLGISANNRPEYTTLRFFFSILAIYSLIITTLYNSKLINVFTNPKDDYQIDSITELLDTNLPIGGRLENVDWFENGDELDMKVFERYNYSEAFRPSPKTVYEISKGKLALLISQYFVEQTRYRDKVFGMTEELFSNHLEMLVERGFPLIKRINKILGLFRDIGIMSKLFKDFQYESNIFTPYKLTKRLELLRHRGKLTEKLEEKVDEFQSKDETEENPEIVLTPEHLQGPFTIWFLGLVVSFGIFLFEVIFNIEKVKIFCVKIWSPFGRKYRVSSKDQKVQKLQRGVREVRFTPKKRRIIAMKGTKSKSKFNKKIQ